MKETVIKEGTYLRIVSKDGHAVLNRMFLPEGSKMIFEEMQRRKAAPWEGTLFNMGVMVRDKEYIGHVVREADDVIVVFADSGGERWDIPKKYIKVTGKNVFCDMNLSDLHRYEMSRESPLPPSIRTDPFHPKR
jgi:hypothetical protein